MRDDGVWCSPRYPQTLHDYTVTLPLCVSSVVVKAVIRRKDTFKYY